jgi:hypothetical protein
LGSAALLKNTPSDQKPCLAIRQTGELRPKSDRNRGSSHQHQEATGKESVRQKKWPQHSPHRSANLPLVRKGG